MRRAPAALLSSFLMAAFTVGVAAGYDPLAVAGGEPRRLDLAFDDETRSREIPLRAYLPTDRAPAPVVLFSHGLGGSRAGSAYLGGHWARRGYVALFLQHPGSDDAVWRSAPPGQRMAALRGAAGSGELQARVADVVAVLDRLAGWSASASHPLAGRLDPTRIGMSGHSFGAVTTQAVSGQTFPFGMSFTDRRVRAAVLMSPSPPRASGDPSRAFAEVEVPWLLLTGTEDDAPIGGIVAASRRLVFPALPAGDKYELVLHGAEHSAFGDRALPGDGEPPRNPSHHRAILAITTAFWDAYLREEPAARRWLTGDGVRAVLAKDDRWQRK